MSEAGDPGPELRRLRWRTIAALVLLCAAGLRHHLVWGESERLPWLLPLLNAGEAACLVGFVVLAGSAWWRCLAVLERRTLPMRELVRLSLPVFAIAIAVPCFLSADPVDYVVRGRVLALHGGNPYLHVAADYLHDPFVGFGDEGWKSMPLPYGPVVANLQAGIAWLAHQLPVPPRVELIVALVLFKLLFTAALLGAAWACGRIATHLAPGREARAFVAVAWNPLLLDDCIANAHNEPLVLVCIAVALAAALASRHAVAVAALCVGAMTKIVPIVLLPVAMVHALRQRRMAAAGLGLAVGAATASVFWWQFFAESGLEFLQRQRGLQGASVWWAVHRVTGIDLAVLTPIGLAIVCAAIGYACARVYRLADARRLLTAVASILLLLGVLGGALFGTWYHAWWMPFALLLGRGYLFRAAVTCSVFAPLAYLPWAGLRRFDEPAQWWIVGLGVLAPLALALRWPRSGEPPRDSSGAA